MDLSLEELDDRIAWLKDTLQYYETLAQIKRAHGDRPKGVVIPQRFREFYQEIKKPDPVPPISSYVEPAKLQQIALDNLKKYKPRENGDQRMVDKIINVIRNSDGGLTVHEIGGILKIQSLAISQCITQNRRLFVRDTFTHRWTLDDSKILS